MILDVFSGGLSDAYELIEDIWDAWDIDAAEGVQQDNLQALRGGVRDPARASTAVLTLGGTPSTVIAAGKRAGVPNDGPIFATDEEVTIGGGGTVDVDSTATENGPQNAAAGSITEIIDAVSGWTSVTNAADAIPGVNVESDSDFRTRGEDISIGSTTEEAIYTRLIELDDVDNAVVISNRTDETDALGTPAHTMWIILWPNTADPAGIANAIWGDAGAPAGIGFRGTQTATVTFPSGFTEQIRWDWATEVEVHVKETLEVDSDYPADGDTLVKAGIVAYGDTLRVGQDVNPAPVDNASYDAAPGIVKTTTTLKVGGTPGPGDTDPIVIQVNEFGSIDSTDVTVVSS
jgi:hypothetical protein